MPIKELLENYGLYQKYGIKIPLMLNEFKKPSIHMNCEICNSEQTFYSTNII